MLHWQLAGILLALCFTAHGQGFKGFSSQTQPSEIIETHVIASESLIDRKKQAFKYREEIESLEAAESRLKEAEESITKLYKKQLSFFTRLFKRKKTRSELEFLQDRYLFKLDYLNTVSQKEQAAYDSLKAKQAVAAEPKNLQQEVTDAKKRLEDTKSAHSKEKQALQKFMNKLPASEEFIEESIIEESINEWEKAQKAVSSAKNTLEARLSADKGASKNKVVIIAAPTIKEVPVSTVNAPDIAIDDATTLLALYDYHSVTVDSRRGLGHWRVGIVSDGDFNKTADGGEASSPKTGSLGVDAIFMKPVYYTLRYEGTGLEPLVGDQVILRPYFSLNTLAILFAQSNPISTGIARGTQGHPNVPLDTKRAFGQAILIPGSNSQSGLSFTINGTWYRWVLSSNKFSRSIGIDYNLNLTQTRWQSRDTTVQVNIFAPFLGISVKAVDKHVKVGNTANNVQVLVFARATMRHLFGDIRAIEPSGRILRDAIGVNDRHFFAPDLGVTTSINAIRLTVNVPMFGMFGSKKRIPGFTGGQPVLGLGLAAAIPITD